MTFLFYFLVWAAVVVVCFAIVLAVVCFSCGEAPDNFPGMGAGYHRRRCWTCGEHFNARDGTEDEAVAILCPRCGSIDTERLLES